MKVLLTSGGTKVPIDKVRSITNMSSGTFGSAICEVFLRQGAHVDFVMAEGSKTPFEVRLNGEERVDIRQFEDWRGFVKQYGKQYKAHTYKTFNEYVWVMSKLMAETKYDIIILAAAVSDYGVANYVDGKVRSSSALEIQLEPLPKVISSVRSVQPDAYFVGFKLLVNSQDEELIAAARQSLQGNNCNMIVANDLRDIQQNDHRLLIVTNESVLEKKKSGTTKSLAQELLNAILCDYTKKIAHGNVAVKGKNAE